MGYSAESQVIANPSALLHSICQPHDSNRLGTPLSPLSTFCTHCTHPLNPSTLPPDRLLFGGSTRQQAKKREKEGTLEFLPTNFPHQVVHDYRYFVNDRLNIAGAIRLTLVRVCQTTLELERELQG